MDKGTEPGKATLVDRIKAIILTPKEEWQKIAAEPTTQTQIITNYVLPLAAIGPVATFIGGQIFGYGLLGVSWRPSPMAAFSQAIVSYVLTIVGVFVLSFIADYLAPKFDGQSDRTSSMKLVAYGATAAWLAGIFGLIPSLAVFGLLGLYSLYLFYTGVTPVMKVPEGKALSYTAVTFLCAIVIFVIVGFIAERMVGQPSRAIMNDAGQLSGTVNIPGAGSIDVGKMQQLGERMEKAASGEQKVVALADLQGLLPATLGSYERTAIESAGTGSIGSRATGTYTSGDRTFELSITDMAGLGALAGLGAAMGVEQNREDANSYERTGTVDGQMQTEAWNRSTNSGKFGKVVGDRFLIEADGQAQSVQELKAAVASVAERDLRRLAE